jgi:tol-pal system protein YbgF
MVRLMQEQRGACTARCASQSVCKAPFPWLRRRGRLGLATALVLAVAGCASVPRPPAPAPDQDRAALDLRAKNAGYVRRIEELENRIFILEDQLDSRKLATEQRAPATLPTRTRTLRSESRASLPLRQAPKGTTSRAAPVASGPPIGEGAISGEGAVSGPGEDTVETTIVAEHAVDYTGDALQGSVPPPPPAAAGSARPMLRLSSVSSARARPARVTPPNSTPEPDTDRRTDLSDSERAVPDPLRIYRGALETLRAGHPEAALPQFRRFLDGNPRHDYADNAQYWIGECHYAEQQFPAAAHAFREVVERYPRGNKVPDAMLKLGFTLHALGDEIGARAVLESLARAFPKHEAARLASERLAHPEAPQAGPGQPAILGTVMPIAAPSATAGAAAAADVGRARP